MAKNKVHFQVPAVTEDFVRAACRCREFTHYTTNKDLVTCKRCINTKCFKERDSNPDGFVRSFRSK